MRRQSAISRLPAFLLSLLVLWITPAQGGDAFSRPAIAIPSTSALPNGQIKPVPSFLGHPATPHPVTGTLSIPQNPFMGADPWNGMHNDSYQSDTYPQAGPLGSQPVVTSTWLGPPDGIQAIVVGMTFDPGRNLLIAAAIKVRREQQTAWVQLTLIDAATLATLARFDLPKETVTGPGFRPAGAYFYMTEDNRIVIGTKDRTIWLISYAYDSSARRWVFHHDNEAEPWDLGAAISDGDSIQALQPDWSGRLWFTSKGGVVGTYDMATGQVIGFLQLPGERIVNGHAAGEEGGVYIASTLAMYRFDADAAGLPVVTWRQAYDAGTHVKEGQTDIGTGTTPTLMGDRYVAITDNGQPRMHVLVYDRDEGELVCAEPVFAPGQAANENSLIATDTSIVVENNFGYRDPLKDTTHGRTTKPGLARIDVENGGCRTVWTNEAVSIPTLISKMSLANGLIYTYTKPKGPGSTDPWYFTAIDFHTGETLWQRLAGIGILYNNHYAGAYLGPDGTLYVGVLGGIVAMRDGN